MARVAADPISNPVTDPVSGHTYQLVEEPLSWPDARAAAAAMGGGGLFCHLATITSQAENDLVLPLIEAQGEDVWIGGEQRITEGCDEEGENDASLWGNWVTGEAWMYTNWAPNQPDDCPDFCLAYSQEEDPAQWDEENCAELIPYLVECAPLQRTPLLSGATLLLLVSLLLAGGFWLLDRRNA